MQVSFFLLKIDMDIFFQTNYKYVLFHSLKSGKIVMFLYDFSEGWFLLKEWLIIVLF